MVFGSGIGIPEMLTVESYPHAGVWGIIQDSTRGRAYDQAVPI
jgi:hypothetical protein